MDFARELCNDVVDEDKSLVLMNGFSCIFFCFKEFFVVFYSEKILSQRFSLFIWAKIRVLVTNFLPTDYDRVLPKPYTVALKPYNWM